MESQVKQDLRAEVKQDLRAVRALFSGPEKWTKGAFARDAHLNKCNIHDPYARCWCLIGAIMKVSDITSACIFEINKILPRPDDGCFFLIPDWQDAPDRTFEDITRVLDAAIEDIHDV